MARYSGTTATPDAFTLRATPWRDWASQIDPLGDRYDWTGPDPLYSYGRRPAAGISYDPPESGMTFEPESSLFSAGTQFQNDFDAWNAWAHPEQAAGFPTTGQVNPGAISSPGGDWAPVDQWNTDILAAVQKVATDSGIYVPPNFVKSIMKLESGGDPTSLSPAGAMGLMQVMPFWGPDLGLDLSNPTQNILAGVTILAQNYGLGNPNDPNDKSWEWAAKRYIGLGGTDDFGTDANSYWKTVSQFWNDINGTAGTGGTTPPPSGGTSFRAIWGNIDAPITQEYGPTDFANGNPLYNYGADYTLDGKPMGHPGLDVGVVYGTNLYTPIGGTVVCAGTGWGTGVDGCIAYTNTDGGGNTVGGDHQGRFQLQLDNGDMLILGHMSQVTVQPGQRLNPGDFVGKSGGQNGDHVHVEYRKLAPGQTTSGFLMVDPRQALQGNFSGSFGQAPTDSTVFQAVPTAQTWTQFMRAGATGQGRLTGAATAGGFHDWIRHLMGVGSAPKAFDPGMTKNWIFNPAPSPPPGQPGTPTGPTT